MKSYNDLFSLFYGDYTLDYCQRNNLFYDLDSEGKIKHITKSLVDYAFEIISTDYALIFGKDFEPVVKDNKKATDTLQEILEFNDFDKLKRLFVLQGLILGDSGLKVGRDDNHNIRIGLVNLLNGELEYEMEYGRLVRWYYRYDVPHLDSTVRVEEIYGFDKIEINMEDKVKTVPNRYEMLWLQHVANIPSLTDPIFGESELARIGDTIDEMNSTLSRISAIEDVYAKPKIIGSGIRDISKFRKEDNIWATPENANLFILEYKGMVIPSMLATYDKLEGYLKNKCPELILNDLGNISGYALKLKLSKLIRKIENYREVYFKALRRIFKLVLLMSGYSADEIEFNVDPVIPADELADLNKLLALLNANVISRETVARELGYNYNEEKPKIKSDAPVSVDRKVTVKEKMSEVPSGIQPREVVKPAETEGSE